MNFQVYKNSSSAISFVDKAVFLDVLEEQSKGLKLKEDTVIIYTAKQTGLDRYMDKQQLEQFKSVPNALHLVLGTTMIPNNAIQVMTQGTTLYGVPLKGSSDRLTEIIFFTSSEQGIDIMSPEGIRIAEYFKEYNTILVHYNPLVNEGIYNSAKIITGILEEYSLIASMTDEELEKRKKEQTIMQITKLINTSYEKLLEQDKKALNEIELDINYLISELARKHTQQRALVKNITNMEKQIGGHTSKVKDDIELILALDKVDNLYIDRNNIIVETKLLYGYTEHNDVYKLAPYKIIINLEKNEVKVDCDEEYKRRSCWGDKCPHPHVSDSLNPCFGNISSTIAQLLSYVELFPLVTIVINYLESINTRDTAGEYCVYWDRVDEETFEVVEKGREYREEYECGCCGALVSEEYAIYCDSCGHYVCEECAIYLNDIDDYGCTNCDDIVYCTRCGDAYCDEYYYCDYCGDIVCEHCAYSEDDRYFCCEDCMEAYFEEEE